MTRRNTTIKDVANTARVSVATVSNVLNGKDGLFSSETADVVWAAVKCLDYRPNQVARSLVHQKTKTLGVVVDRAHGRLTRNAYINGLLDGFLEFATDAGYQIKLFSLSTESHSATLEQLEDGSVDGLALFAPPANSELLPWAARTRMPLVFAGSAPPATQFASVDIDDVEAARMAVNWLIAQGHTRIGWICGPLIQWSSGRREEGYRKAMQEAGLAIRPEWRYVWDSCTVSGAAAAAALFQTSPDLTALLCWNDSYALEIMQELQRQGIRIPEDVSVIGFDDIEAAHWVQPALTTVQQPISKIGHKAAEVLIRQIKTGNAETDLTVFRGELIVRASASSPSQHQVRTAQ
jgi:LacI family transcriptional regulator/LacI family purine nucleotide synthesis repressor